MHRSVRVDGARRRDERLPCDLTAENALQGDLRAAPENTSGSTDSRSSRSTSASTTGWFSTSAISAVTLQDVSDVMHPDGVGRSGRRRRRTRDDNDKVVEVADAALNKCGIDLANHLVRGARPSRSGALRPPTASHLPLHILIGREDGDAGAGCSRDSRRAVSPVWVNATKQPRPTHRRCPWLP